LLAREALEVLALQPGATPSEIKEAYRDLVKVWHPDRFGSDVRLRQKAEDKLKQVNEAYRVLQAEPGVSSTYSAASASAANSSRGDPASSWGTYGQNYSSTSASSASASSASSKTSWPGAQAPTPTARHDQGTPKGRHEKVVWAFVGAGVFVILLAGLFAVRHGLMRDVGLSSASATEQPFMDTPATPVPRPTPTTSGAEARAGAEVRPKGTSHAKEPNAGPFQVRMLSDAENAQVEAACARQRQVHGMAAYHACLKAQLDLTAHATSQPDLSALSATERESVESACAAAQRRGGPNGFNHCETEQLARLAAEPARPDLSALNEADRRAIESACAAARNREGPAAYDRCVDRFMKTLAEAK
jgi:DnaJ domain